MPLWIMVCDDEAVADSLKDTLSAATGGKKYLVAPRIPPQQKSIRAVAEGVCAVLHISPAETTLVSLLGGKPGTSNLTAIACWCETALPQLDDTTGSDLVEALASRLHAHLIGKMH